MLSSEGAFVGECFRQTTRTVSMVIGSTPKANTFPDLSFEPEAMACRGFKRLPANLGFPANLEPDRRWRWPRDRAIAKGTVQPHPRQTLPNQETVPFVAHHRRLDLRNLAYFAI